jgi:hypothetical protein
MGRSTDWVLKVPAIGAAINPAIVKAVEATTAAVLARGITDRALATAALAQPIVDRAMAEVTIAVPAP